MASDHSIFSFTISTPGIEEFVKISEKMYYNRYSKID